MIITSILGILTGVVWPILLLTSLRPAHYNKVSSLHVMDYFDPVSHLLKLAPTVAAVILIGKVCNCTSMTPHTYSILLSNMRHFTLRLHPAQIYKLYASAGKDQCSDDVTNQTFDYLAETLPAIYDKSCVTLGVEVALMAVRNYHCCQIYLHDCVV